MKLKTYFTNFHYKKNYSFLEKILYAFLYPVSLLYLIIASIRNGLYYKNILQSEHPGVKVISIGNITTGGTGKTPFVLELAKYFSAKTEYKVAILSRGYGRKSKEKVITVRTADKILLNDPAVCGDEPYMMAKSLKNVAIFAGSRRILLAKEAVDRHNCNLLILDDGFQHQAIKRDLNILLVDKNNLFGNGQILPLGPLREPLSSIKRADAIVTVDKTGTDTSSKEDLKLLEKYQKPVFTAHSEFKGLLELPDMKNVSDTAVKKIVAFSGIAQPEIFYNMLQKQGYDICKTITFDDHWTYKPEDIKDILETAKKANAEAIITTEKDAIKVLNLIEDTDIPFYAVRISMQFDIEEILKLWT